MATMSLLGLYQYDNTILDGLKACLPSEKGLPLEYPETYLKGVEIDAQALTEALLIETAEQEVLYSNPGFLKLAISSWAKKQKFVWQHLYNTICLNYNPIWNKDGTVTWTEAEKGSGSNTRTKKGTNAVEETTTTEGTNSVDREESGNSSGTDNSTTTNSVSAYNATDFQNRDKSVQSQSTSETSGAKGKEESSGSYTTTRGLSGNDDLTDTTNRSDTKSTEHSQRETGNIGVTMTQDMIEKERVLAQFNMFDFIITDFKKRFILMVY